MLSTTLENEAIATRRVLVNVASAPDSTAVDKCLGFGGGGVGRPQVVGDLVPVRSVQPRRRRGRPLHALGSSTAAMMCPRLTSARAFSRSAPMPANSLRVRSDAPHAAPASNSTHPLHGVGVRDRRPIRRRHTVGMTMSLHKLSAGHGYDYLIRQVAAHDATHRGRTDLASYYEGRGETPGRWVGRGLAGIDGLEVGDVVTGEQMRLLFAEGRHPLAGASPGGTGGFARRSVCRIDRVAGSSRSWRRFAIGSPPTTPRWGSTPMRRCRRRRGRGSAANWPQTGSSRSTAVPPATSWNWSVRWRGGHGPRRRRSGGTT